MDFGRGCACSYILAVWAYQHITEACLEQRGIETMDTNKSVLQADDNLKTEALATSVSRDSICVLYIVSADAVYSGR